MFFILSKLLYFLLQPLNWLIGLPIYAIFTKNARRKRRVLRGCFALLVLITNPFLGNRVFHAFEAEPVSMGGLRDTFDVGIVLGGYTKGGTYAEDRLNFSYAANRLTDAVQAYKRGIIRKLLISGGDGKLIGASYPESELAKTFALDMGVKPEDLLIEDNSRNTHENAVFSKQILEKQGITNAKILVFTSASHIPRAIGCFKKIGINAQPFPTSFVANRLNFQLESWLIPDPEMIRNWESFIKEWIGSVVYKIQGYT